MGYDPSAYLIKIQGKDYLPVSERIFWFRTVNPGWCIETLLLQHEPDVMVIWQAQIKDAEGHLIATAHALQTKAATKIGSMFEAGETSAIGRALGIAGFGTRFSSELDEGSRVVDTPNRTNGTDKTNTPGATHPARQPVEATGSGPNGGEAHSTGSGPSAQSTGSGSSTQRSASEILREEEQANARPQGCEGPDCGKPLTAGQRYFSSKTYGMALCIACQRKQQNGELLPAGTEAGEG